MKKIDLTNQIFGYLTVLKDSNERTKHGEVIWECQCICGNIKKRCKQRHRTFKTCKSSGLC